MKSTRKLMSLLLALALVGTLFAACAPAEETPTDTDTSTPAEDTAEPAEDDMEVTTIKYAMPGNAPTNPDYVVEALNEYSREQIGVEVEFQYATDSDQIKTAVSTGTTDYDIVFTCAWYNHYVPNATAGFLADLTELLPSVTPDLYDFIPESIWDGTKINGSIYAIPVYKDTAAQQFWIVNADYVLDEVGAQAEFDALGRELSTVTPLLEKIYNYTETEMGGVYPNDLPAVVSLNKGGLNGLDNQFDKAGLDDVRYLGIDLLTGSTTLELIYTNEKYLDDLNELASWQAAGYVNPDANVIENEYPDLVVGSAQGWEDAKFTAWGAPAAGKTYNADVMAKTDPIITTGTIQGSMSGIPTNAPNVEAALKWLELANLDPTFRNMFAYGVEGTTWELNDEGTVDFLTEDWKVWTFSQATFFTLTPSAGAPVDMYDKLKEVNDNAEASPLAGFIPDLSGIQTEVAACAQIATGYGASLSTGIVPNGVDATVASLDAELKAAGIETIQAEVQAQIDAWLAA